MSSTADMPTARPDEIAVIGAGVVGLTTALCLLRQGHAVAIYAKESTPATTSDVAAAVWLPYKVETSTRAEAWARRTRTLYRQMEQEGVPGIRFVPLLLLVHRAPSAEEWRLLEPALGEAGADELPPGFARVPKFSVPRIETPLHMAWLRAECTRRGARFITAAVGRADELLDRHRVVVNCTGAGAAATAADETVYPIRGQVVRTSRPAGLDDTVLIQEGETEVTYIVPRDQDCILGGTAEAGVWSTMPDARTAEAILARCIQLRPILAGATVLEHRAGLRPARPTIRLETEIRPGRGALVHHYGHGGAGFTLGWASAEDAADLVRRFLDSPAAAPPPAATPPQP